MDNELLKKLKFWRDEVARRKGVEFYRVLNNQSLDEIVAKKPCSREELMQIKGIKEKKYAMYGEDILAMVRGDQDDANFMEEDKRSGFSREEVVYEVGEYLDHLNTKLLDFEARVKGEVTSVDLRGSYIFFSIKDKLGESMLNCFMWQNDYMVSGLDLEEGMEIITWGYPNIFKPSGRMSFQVKLLELVGEGALKKAYDELKRKLESEGLFAPERKKPIPDFAHSIGLITSHQGAAIGDFISNLGSHGFKIKFYDSRVEGKQAVFDLMKGIQWFNQNLPQLDALVIVRGGGSLESLQAFNSEALVREVANSKIPVLAGIGHDKDISLVALAADLMVSTPTAVALELRRPWDEAIHQLGANQKLLLSNFSNSLGYARQAIDRAEDEISSNLQNIFNRFSKVKQLLYHEIQVIGNRLATESIELQNYLKTILSGFRFIMNGCRNELANLEKKLELNNPERQLRLGYSLVRSRGKLIRDVGSLKIGDEVDVDLASGGFSSVVKKIINK